MSVYDAVIVMVGYTIGTVVSRWLFARIAKRREHRRTDPACSEYRPVRGPFARWRDRRSRGKSCQTCRAILLDAGWRWVP